MEVHHPGTRKPDEPKIPCGFVIFLRPSVVNNLESEITLNRIVTHDDLDGVVSAALLSLALDINSFFFTGPVSIQDGRTRTSEQDVVCDLPCPVRVGMWFDHHPGNLEDLILRGVPPEDVPGRFAAEPSCARVIYGSFAGKVDFPEYMEETVTGTDRVDSFDYRSMDQWREPTPERLLSDSIFAASLERGSYSYLERMVRYLRDGPMERALDDHDIRLAVERFKSLESNSLKLFQPDSGFHPDDPMKQVVIIDLTRHNRKPEVIRGAAFILYPESWAALLVMNGFSRGKKTNDLSFSMSLSFLMNRREHSKDIGEIMRSLNMGDGHPGAGAGRIQCRSKKEMLKVKEETIDSIIRMWNEMG